MERHGLERVAEIAVVGIGPRRNARGHLLVELAWVQPPLLARVAAEEQLIELRADGVDDHIFRRLDLVDRFGSRREILGCLLVGLEVEVEQHVERGAIDRDRHQFLAHIGEHAVLVRPPLGELRQVIDDLFAVGVEDVRAVFVIENPGLVGLVIGIAADVRTAVDQQHPRAVLARQPLGKDRAGEPGPDYQIIIFPAGARSDERCVHSAATNCATMRASVRVPRRSAMSPAIRAWVVSQLVAESSKSASASQPLSG